MKINIITLLQCVFLCCCFLFCFVLFCFVLHFHFTQIRKASVDHFGCGRTIPKCELLLQWPHRDKPRVCLVHDIDLTGAKDCSYFTLYIPDEGERYCDVVVYYMNISVLVLLQCISVNCAIIIVVVLFPPSRSNMHLPQQRVLVNRETKRKPRPQ